jgi:hypothetical protein
MTVGGLKQALLNFSSMIWDFNEMLKSFLPNSQQSHYFAAYAGMLAFVIVVDSFLMTKRFLYPFELISTVFHEFGHGLVTVLTGGRVLSISINLDKSGLIRYVGGSVCLILPAGYIGSSVAGGVLLFFSFDKKYSDFATKWVNVSLWF